MVERKVRTPEGARMFGVPIGTVIEDRTSPDVARTKRPVTNVRLISLQRQFQLAKKQGNLDAMREIQEQFTAAIKDFSGSRQLISTIKDLVASRGRADQDLGKRPGIAD
ncbi:hypothetical protein SEA_MAGRITTE_14 [Microbacterium phage Magritte]|nr:hypothetical protein SEA_MAGRITTE_14 [Microbacterium phage Magritte]